MKPLNNFGQPMIIGPLGLEQGSFLKSQVFQKAHMVIGRKTMKRDKSFESLLQEIDTYDVSSKGKTVAVFYSGGQYKKNKHVKAWKFIDENGGIARISIIDETPGSRELEKKMKMAKPPFLPDQIEALRSRLSVRFAEQVQGQVFAFCNTARETGIFLITEWRALQNNFKVLNVMSDEEGREPIKRKPVEYEPHLSSEQVRRMPVPKREGVK